MSGWPSDREGCPVTDDDTEDDDYLEPGQDRAGQIGLCSNKQVPNNSSATELSGDGQDNNLVIKGPPVGKLDPSVLTAALDLAASNAERIELNLSDDEDTDDEEERILNE